MADADNLRIDAGAVNARILAKEAKTDFRRIEGASIKMRTQFASAEGKRFYVRFFHSLQLQTHFISVIARTRFPAEEVLAIESGIRERIDAVAAGLDQAIDDVEKLFRANGISAPASYDTVPLELEVHVLSSTGRRFLELLNRLDQLMPLLQTLEIHEIVPSPLLDLQRATMKRQVRDVANAARSQATALRRRMNESTRAEGQEPAGGGNVVRGPAEGVDQADAADAGRAGEGTGQAVQLDEPATTVPAHHAPLPPAHHSAAS